MKILRNKFVKKVFLSKLSRKREREFLSRYASDLRALDIGAKTKDNGRYFPNLTVLNIDSGPNIDIVADAENLKDVIPDASFDIVLCMSVLEHTRHPNNIVDSIARILKRNGLVIISVPFIMSLHDTPNDYWRFTRYGLLELFKDFELIEMKDSMNSLETIGYLYHRLFLQTKSFTKISNLFFFLLSKINYLLGKLFRKQEFGHYFTYKQKRQESSILTNNIMAVFKK